MRILLVGDSFELQDNAERYTRRALEALGHVVIPFDCLLSRATLVTLLPVTWRQRLRRLVPPPRHWWPILRRRETAAMGQALLECVAREQPDVLFVFKGTPLTPEVLRTVWDRFRIPRLNWCPDDPFRYLSDAIYPCYEVFCVANPTCLEPLRRRGARQVLELPFACDPTVHRRLELDEAERHRWHSDVCFVGSYHPRREAFLNALTAWDLAIWGPGWEQLSTRSPLRPSLRGGAIRVAEWVKAYNAASLVLNISHPQERDVSLPMRIFEALACGAPLLTTWSTLAAQLFRVGVELETFRTPEELCHKVRYYLDHPDERRQMAERGQAAVYAEHTYVHRMQKLLPVIEAIVRAPGQR